MDLLVAKQDSILALSNTVRVETVDFDSACNDAIALGAGAYSDGTTLTKLGAFKTAAAAIEDARVSIDDAIRGMDIKSSRDSFSDNGRWCFIWQYQGWLLTLYVLLVWLPNPDSC